MKSLLNLAYRYRIILILATILIIFGLTLLKALAISNPTRDEVYIKAKQEETNISQVKIDKKLEDQINQLLETPVDVQPKNLGTKDPFNP